MHVVTDNGSNYKKACKELLSDVYDHIAWTPCLAHTVNLMLKDIARRPEHGVIIKQCKRISNWLHNHGQLNTMMRNAIGGELVKWNATRFGTNYMFLESIYRKCDRFMQWMAYQNMKQELRSFFGTNISTLKEYIEVVDERLGDMFIGTYVGLGNHTRVIYF